MKKSFAVVFVLVMVLLISLHPIPGESYKLTMICKKERRSRAPFPCIKSNCEGFCAKMHSNGWGKCKDDNEYVCQCFHICYRDISPDTPDISVHRGHRDISPDTPNADAATIDTASSP